MTRQEMASWLSSELSNGNQDEERRLYTYYVRQRTLPQVAETYRRQRAIAAVTDAECRLHCQPGF